MVVGDGGSSYLLLQLHHRNHFDTAGTLPKIGVRTPDSRYTNKTQNVLN